MSIVILAAAIGSPLSVATWPATRQVTGNANAVRILPSMSVDPCGGGAPQLFTLTNKLVRENSRARTARLPCRTALGPPEDAHRSLVEFITNFPFSFPSGQ